MEETFSFPVEKVIVYSGTDDLRVGWSDSKIPERVAESGHSCILIPNANHSFETGKVEKDLENLKMIMEETERFIKEKEER